MRTAVCFTGQCRSLEHTHENIKKYLLEPLGECDIFMYISENNDSFKAEKYMSKVATDLRVEPDVHVDESDITHQQAIERGGLQGYMQMLRGMKKCNEMRTQHEKENNFQYDRIIRSRLDVEYFRSLPEDFDSYDLNYLYIPDFHCWSIVQGNGYNDRFAVGNRNNMNIYLSELDYIRRYSLQGFTIHAESTLYVHLKSQGVKVKKVPIRFTRIRHGGIREDMHINEDPSTWPEGEGC